jgi:hypothetical protein
VAPRRDVRRPARSRAISNLFLPPEASTAWIDLPPGGGGFPACA